MANFSLFGTNAQKNVSQATGFFSNILGGIRNAVRGPIESNTGNMALQQMVTNQALPIQPPVSASNPVASTSNSQPTAPVMTTPVANKQITPPTSSSTVQVPQSSTSTFPGAYLAGIEAKLAEIQKQAEVLQKSQTNPEKPASLTSAENNQTSLIQQITDAAKRVLGVKNEASTMADELKLKEQTQEINNTQLELAAKLAEYKQALTNIEGKPIPLEDISLETERLQRVYATDVAVKEAYLSALQGNYSRSKSVIDDIIKLKLEPAQQELTNLQTFYNLNQDVLSTEMSQYKSIVDNAIKNKEAQLKATEDNLKSNQSLYTQIANSGNFAMLKNFNFDAPYSQNLAQYGGGLKNATTGTTEESIVNKFRTALVNRSDLDAAGNREQFIRQLIARFPEIDPSSISEYVYATYPDNYEQ